MGPTYFGLLAEFNASEIPLDACCDKYFSIGIEQAKRLAAKYQLPVPAYRSVGSQKGHWLISAHDLATHLDKMKAEHGKRFRVMNGPLKDADSRNAEDSPNSHAA